MPLDFRLAGSRVRYDTWIAHFPSDCSMQVIFVAPDVDVEGERDAEFAREPPPLRRGERRHAVAPFGSLDLEPCTSGIWPRSANEPNHGSASLVFLAPRLIESANANCSGHGFFTSSQSSAAVDPNACSRRLGSR
jgi:hypothetical protein